MAKRSMLLAILSITISTTLLPLHSDADPRPVGQGPAPQTAERPARAAGGSSGTDDKHEGDKLYFGFIKDPAAVIISSLALIVAALGYLQRSFETRIAKRRQLSDALLGLTQVNLELEKTRSASDAVRTFSPIVGILNDQRRNLVRQAAFLIDRLPSDVSTPEFLTLAWAFNAIDDAFEAERSFIRAVAVAPDDINRCIALRSYARFTFAEGDFEGGRGLYRRAVAVVSSPIDRQRHYYGETMERWAVQEAEWGDPERAAALLAEAVEKYRSISHPTMQDRNIARANELRTLHQIEEPSLSHDPIE
jgi:tetratricopeptide (TPR) repeat protein